MRDHDKQVMFPGGWQLLEHLQVTFSTAIEGHQFGGIWP
jgi:hypothetical protein